MKIYTGTGDTGETTLIGGTTVSKSDYRLDAYGTIDELNSEIGWVLSQNQEWHELNDELIILQHLLFDVGHDFSTPYQTSPYRLNQENITWLEERIDSYSQMAPEINHFILPGGTPLASQMHRLRTITRRAERCCVRFTNDTDDYNPKALIFLNRLSDYFFVVARASNARKNIADLSYERQ